MLARFVTTCKYLLYDLIDINLSLHFKCKNINTNKTYMLLCQTYVSNADMNGMKDMLVPYQHFAHIAIQFIGIGKRLQKKGG